MSGRLEKTGLDFFPFRTDFFQDPKIRLLTVNFGPKGQIVIIRLFCEIYRYQGYYLKWNEETSLLLASEFGNTFTNGFLTGVLNESLKRGIFDKDIFDRFSVLTSKGIQERYYKICRDAKRKSYQINPDYCLIDINSGNTPEEIELTPEEMQNTPELIAQSKEKQTFKNKLEIQSCSNSSSCSAAGKTGQIPETGTIFFIPPDEGVNLEQLWARVIGLFRNYCSKAPHSKEISGVIEILVEGKLSDQDAWNCALQSFEEYPLLDKCKQNTKYLLAMIRGKIKDILDRERKESAKKQKKETLPYQNWGTKDSNAVRDWVKEHKNS